MGTTEPLAGVLRLEMPMGFTRNCWLLCGEVYQVPEDILAAARKCRLKIAALLLRLGEAHGLPILAGYRTCRRDWGLLGLILRHA